MPDIFGREAHEYRHIRALQEAGLWEQQQAARAAELPGIPPHDFHALGRGYNPNTISRFEGDAQALGFVTNNLQAIVSMGEEILYTGFRLDEFLPIVGNIPEGATEYSYRVTDQAGEGAFISNDGTNAPTASVAQKLVPYPLRYAGIVPHWTVEDLRRAMMTGLALDTETIMAGMTGAMNHIEKVAFSGIADEGVKGLVNLPTSGTGAVTQNSQAANKEIVDDLTAEEVRHLLISEIGALIEDSNQIFGRQLRSGLCIYLPQAEYNYVTSTPIGDNSDKSIWDFVMAYNPWTQMTGEAPMLKALLELKSAGGTNINRMVTAINDLRVWEIAVPFFPRILTTINEGYRITAPIEYKVSALNVKRPKAIRYRDKI